MTSALLACDRWHGDPDSAYVYSAVWHFVTCRLVTASGQRVPDECEDFGSDAVILLGFHCNMHKLCPHTRRPQGRGNTYVSGPRRRV